MISIEGFINEKMLVTLLIMRSLSDIVMSWNTVIVGHLMALNRDSDLVRSDYAINIIKQIYELNRDYQSTDLQTNREELIKPKMRKQPTDGSVYIFINRRRDRMKLLMWQSSGFILYYKRLERGTFELPENNVSEGKLKINIETLLLMVRGIRLKKIVRKTRYNK